MDYQLSDQKGLVRENVQFVMESSLVRDISLELTAGNEKQIPKNNDTQLSEAIQTLSITWDKKKIPKDNLEAARRTRRAVKLLMSRDLLNAFNEIQNALKLHPENDKALTIRGKIYLALAGGKSSRKVKKAFIDFEAAMQLNKYNMEAAQFRDAILMESRLRFIEQNKLERAREIDVLLEKRVLSEETKAFLESIKKRGARPKRSFSTGTGASTFQCVPILIPKEEPMDA